MSRQQRQKIDAMLRQPRPEGPPPSVEELRAGFAALMSRMIVPPVTSFLAEHVDA